MGCYILLGTPTFQSTRSRESATASSVTQVTEGLNWAFPLTSAKMPDENHRLLGEFSQCLIFIGL